MLLTLLFIISTETWKRVQIRYEREAVALQRILPEIHVNIFDTSKYILVGIVKDFRSAISKGIFKGSSSPLLGSDGLNTPGHIKVIEVIE